jgi:hypothetical protein
MEREQVGTLAEFLTFCDEHAREIYVRECIDGKWDAYVFADLPRELRSKWLAFWIEEGMVPVTLRSDAEIVAAGECVRGQNAV